MVQPIPLLFSVIEALWVRRGLVSGDEWFFGVLLNRVRHLWPGRDCFYSVPGYLISLAFSFAGFWSYETCGQFIPQRSLIKHSRTLLKYTIHKIQCIHHTDDNFSDGLKELGPDYIIFGWQAESSPLYVNRICLRTSGSLFALMATPGHSISGWVMEARDRGRNRGRSVCVCDNSRVFITDLHKTQALFFALSIKHNCKTTAFLLSVVMRQKKTCFLLSHELSRWSTFNFHFENWTSRRYCQSKATQVCYGSCARQASPRGSGHVWGISVRRNCGSKTSQRPAQPLMGFVIPTGPRHTCSIISQGRSSSS